MPHAFHQEAQRRQRLIERKHDALERLATKKAEQDQARKEEIFNGRGQTRSGTRAGTRADIRTGTRAGTRAGQPRDPVHFTSKQYQTSTGSAFYRGLIPPKQKSLHQWRGLDNRVRHDADLVPKPYKNEDIVKR